MPPMWSRPTVQKRFQPSRAPNPCFSMIGATKLRAIALTSRSGSKRRSAITPRPINNGRSDSICAPSRMAGTATSAPAPPSGTNMASPMPIIARWNLKSLPPASRVAFHCSLTFG